MEEHKDEETLKFLKYWEQRFEMIMEQNTNWTRLFLIVDYSTFPTTLSIESFCSKFSQDLQFNISYKRDESSNNYDLTITR